MRSTVSSCLSFLFYILTEIIVYPHIGLPAGRSSLITKQPSVSVHISYNNVPIGRTSSAARCLDPRWLDFKLEDFITLNVPLIEEKIIYNREKQGESNSSDDETTSAVLINDSASSTFLQRKLSKKTSNRQGIFASLTPLQHSISKTGNLFTNNAIQRGILPSDKLLIQLFDESKAVRASNGTNTNGQLIGFAELKSNELADFIAMERLESKRCRIPITLSKEYQMHHSSIASINKSHVNLVDIEIVISDNSECVPIIVMDGRGPGGSKQKNKRIMRNKHLHLGTNSVSIEQRPVDRETDLVLKITSCRNFQIDKNNINSCNIFYVVWSNERLVGKSSVYFESSCPKFENDSFVVPIENTDVSAIIVEFYDLKTSGVSNFVGNIVIPSKNFQDFNLKAQTEMEWIALSKSDYIPNHCQTHIFGDVQLTLLPSGFIFVF